MNQIIAIDRLDTLRRDLASIPANGEVDIDRVRSAIEQIRLDLLRAMRDSGFVPIQDKSECGNV